MMKELIGKVQEMKFLGLERIDMTEDGKIIVEFDEELTLKKLFDFFGDQIENCTVSFGTVSTGIGQITIKIHLTDINVRLDVVRNDKVFEEIENAIKEHGLNFVTKLREEYA